LPDWPFLGQISKIWPRFKLVGLKSFSWPFGLFWPQLNLASLKNLFGLKKANLATLNGAFWLLLGHFHAEIGSYEGKYSYSNFSVTHLQTFVINAIPDVRILIFVIFEGC